MAISEQQRQKKLAKKKQKRASVTPKKTTLSLTKAKPYTSFPIHECLIPNNLFTSGIGELLVTRRLPSDHIAMSAFVLDVFCLGVKDAMFRILTEYEYENTVKAQMTANDRRFETLHQTCAKKLLDGLVNYASELGFSPHPDYKNANELFGNIDTHACPVKYTYGKNGKPFYTNGPYESPDDINRIINTLNKSCGKEGFGQTIIIGDFDDDFF